MAHRERCVLVPFSGSPSPLCDIMRLVTFSGLRELPALARETARDLDQFADETVTAWREGNPWRVMVEFVSLMTALFFLAFMGMVVAIPFVVFLLWL